MCCTSKRKVAGSFPGGESGFFIFNKSQYGHGADSDSKGNDYQDYFLGVKAAGA